MRIYAICTLYSVHCGGRTNPIFANGKMCVFPFSPWGKMGKKVYGKKGKSIHFPLFPYTFFPMGKNGKTHIFLWAKMGLDPPYIVQCTLHMQHIHFYIHSVICMYII